MTPAAKVASAIVIAGLATTSVAGCAEIERSTGIGTKGQVGTVGGATVGGLIAAAAGASPAWIAGSVILGALTGGVIGSILDDRDKELHAQSSYNAIKSKKAGGQTAWNNPDTGSSGTTSKATANGRVGIISDLSTVRSLVRTMFKTVWTRHRPTCSFLNL